uniref:Uncharacterized protein n=1 Tax=Amphimedon queenslandica TaxID=400682 RepID=A0A1X7SN31_AMPQE
NKKSGLAARLYCGIGNAERFYIFPIHLMGKVSGLGAKGAWVELGKIWEQIDELRDKPWLTVQPRK